MRFNVTVIRRRKVEPVNVESLYFDVKGNNGAFLWSVRACYSSPGKCKRVNFLNSLATALELMYNPPRQKVVVIGDLNST